MAIRAKKILQADTLEIVADRGYYDPVRIKEIQDNGITCYIPKPTKKRPGVEDDYLTKNFKYDKENDTFACPNGIKLSLKRKAMQRSKLIRHYTSEECKNCADIQKCTTNKKGRSICRWEHENILEEMQVRIDANKEKMRLRRCLSEHPFGTIKRSFDQGYVLMKGLKKVEAEISLTVLSYNVKRAINILGIKALIAAL